MRPDVTLISHLIWGVFILLCIINAEDQRVRKSPIPNAYAHIQKNYPKFLPEVKNEHELIQLKMQLDDFYHLAVGARIYVVQYQPQNISEAFLQSCFEPQLASKELKKTDVDHKQCRKLHTIIKQQATTNLIIKKQTTKPVIIIFQSDLPVTYSFEGTTSRVRMIFLSGHSYTQIQDSRFTHVESARSNKTPGLPFYSNSYSEELCDMCTRSTINYFRNHKSRAELEQAVKVYFNQPLYKIITIHQLSRVILK